MTEAFYLRPATCCPNICSSFGSCSCSLAGRKWIWPLITFGIGIGGLQSWPRQPATLPTSFLLSLFVLCSCSCLARTPAAASNKFSSSFAIAIEIDPDLECWMYRTKGREGETICVEGKRMGGCMQTMAAVQSQSNSRFQFQFRNCFRFCSN